MVILVISCSPDVDVKLSTDELAIRFAQEPTYAEYYAAQQAYTSYVLAEIRNTARILTEEEYEQASESHGSATATEIYTKAGYAQPERGVELQQAFDDLHEALQKKFGKLYAIHSEEELQAASKLAKRMIGLEKKIPTGLFITDSINKNN